MNTSSPTFLQLFYQAIHEWIVAGLPEDPVRNPYGFGADTGLCTNMIIFGRSQYMSNDELLAWNSKLKLQFMDAGLHNTYPFGGYHQYQEEYHSNSIYQNQDRLDWIKNHV